MITCSLIGGLGNQLFQIFTVISYALQNKNKSSFLYTKKTMGMTDRNTYWDSFLSSLHIMLTEKMSYTNINMIKEKAFSYEELPVISSSENAFLSGYFQSYKYFEAYSSQIFRLIRLEKQKQDIRSIVDANSNTGSNTDIKVDLDNTISIHFRIGDYKKIQDKHPILPLSYYVNSLHYIFNLVSINKPNLTVLYFCEQHDLEEVKQMIDELDEIYPGLTFQYVDFIQEDWQQMLLMSCCKYNIIANSTFSWWGAYFNVNYHKIVCYPSVWFGPGLHHYTKDLFPSDWISIPL